MSDMPPPPPPPQGGGYGAPPPPLGQPRPGELLDRFLARLIDGVLLGIAFGVLFTVFAAALISDTTIDSRGNIDEGSTLLFGIVFGVVAGAASLAYYALMESKNGATVGKQLMKLKVVGPDGVGHPTLEQAVRRNIFVAAPLGYIIPVLGPLLAGLAALVGQILIAVGINNDPARRQAWHDKFAGGTQVLKIG